DEEGSRLSVEKRDTTRRVTWRVKDLQDTLAKVNVVSMLEPAGRGATGNSRAGIEIAGKPVGIDRYCRKFLDIAVSRIPGAKRLGFGRVDQDVVETEAGADVVPVGMRLQHAGT